MTTETNGTGAESQETGTESVNTETTQVESPEQSQEQQAAQQPEQKETPPKVVPLAALHEERNERKRLQQEMAQLKREQAARDEVINRRLAALAPKEATPQAPDPAENAVGYIDHRIGEVKQMLQPLADSMQQQRQQQEQAQTVQALANQVQMSEAAFRRANPDYDEAVQHLTQARAAELAVFGLAPEAIAQRIRQETAQMALQWAHQGMNPAEVAYGLAQARGYAKKAEQQAQQQQQTAQEKVAAQQRGAKAAQSLGGGGAVGGQLTAEALAKMSDEDFAKLTTAQWQQAMGG